MIEQPAVSVIIATYNRVNLLAETIDSVLNQRFKDFELIVVDDGSTDETDKLLAAYGTKIRAYHQNNSGPSAARNLGVRQARGPWIAIQDSDDLSAPNHLEVLYRYAQEHPDCGMVFANGNYLGGPAHDRASIIPLNKSRRLAARGVRLEDLFDKSIVRLQASLISKSAYDAVGGHDESLRICMDLDLSLRLVMNWPVGYIDETVFFYRRHAGNIGRNEELRLSENIRVIEKLLADYPLARDILGKGRVARRLAYRYYRLAKGRWKRGQYDDACRAIREATLLRPYAVKYRFYQLHWQLRPGVGLRRGI